MRLKISGLFLFMSLIAFATAAADQPGLPRQAIGFNSLDYMDSLPLLRDLIVCREASTHDKMGGNDNGFTNKAEFVRREFGTRVAVMDVAGSGCLMSFWYSWPNTPELAPTAEPLWKLLLGKVRFFFDGERSPRLAVPLRSFIGQAPRSWPLAVNADESNGGYVSYAPMPFSDGLRVSVDGGALPMFFYHLWYHSYPWGTAVSTWTGKEDLAKAANEWDPAVADEPAGSMAHEDRDLVVQPGGIAEIASLQGCGMVRTLRLDLPEDDTALRNLWLRVFWDGEDTPSIEAPVSLVFAIENRFSAKKLDKRQNAELKGLVIGKDKGGLNCLRLPMPYGKSARIELKNTGTESVTVRRVRVEYDACDVASLRSMGYLRAQFRESDRLTPGRDYVLAELKGRGHIVGTVLAVEDAPVNFLEGDERVYTDGGRSPLVMGDATETYFNGSWYFLGRAFSCPVNGAPTFNEHDGLTDVTMYRFHLTDLVPYRGSARFTIQHGAFNNIYGRYRSVVFYYGRPKPSLIKTDYLELSDPSDLAAHDYSGADDPRLTERSGFFEGEFNGVDLGLRKKPAGMDEAAWMFRLMVEGDFHKPPTDSPDRVSFHMAHHDRPYEFTVKVDPAASAVMLRRVLDQSVRDQKAVIEVDGRKAGVWFNTGNNRWKIFAEDDLILDPAATAGKDRIRIRVVPQKTPFTAAEYTVFSIVIPG